MRQVLTILGILAVSQFFAFTFAPTHPVFMVVNAIAMAGMGFGAYFVGLAQARRETEAEQSGVRWLIAVVVIVGVSQFFALLMTPADPISLIIGSTIMSGIGMGAFFTGLAQGRRRRPTTEEDCEED